MSASQGFNIQIKGLQELSQYASTLAERFITELQNQVTTVFEEGVSQMKTDCPVHTGRLRGSISLTKGGSGAPAASAGTTIAEIDIPTPYAGFVNFGTSRQAPNPFATNGYNYIMSQLEAKLLSSSFFVK